MKYLLSSLTLFAILFLTHTVKAQRFSPIGKIYYQSKHRYDTSLGATVFNDATILYYSQNESIYKSYGIIATVEAVKKWKDNGSIGHPPMPGRGSQDIYYTSFTSNEVSRLRAFANYGSTQASTYAMPEKLETIKWTIIKETKKFGEYTCQKAVCRFRGRNFTAWFCPDIPYRFGPWKLQGLPGLIFEAKDEKNDVSFTFSKIETAVAPEIVAAYSFSPVITTEKEFELMRKAYYDNPEANGIRITLTNTKGEEVKGKRPIINNPMDLKTRLPWML